MFAGKEKAYKEYCENTFSLKFENLMSSNVYSTNQRTNPHVKESSKFSQSNSQAFHLKLFATYFTWLTDSGNATCTEIAAHMNFAIFSEIH